MFLKTSAENGRHQNLHARLAAVEEELRATKAAAIDNERLTMREQLRTLTSDLIAIQSLVRTLTAEKSRLMRENETGRIFRN